MNWQGSYPVRQVRVLGCKYGRQSPASSMQVATPRKAVSEHMWHRSSAAIGVVGVEVPVEVKVEVGVAVAVLVAVVDAQRVSNPPQQSPLLRHVGSQKHVVRRVVPGRGGARMGSGSLQRPSQSPRSSRKTVVVVVTEVVAEVVAEVVVVVDGVVVGLVDGIPEQK